MRRIRLTVAYDGTNYCGWQLQPNGITIEEVLNRTLTELLGHRPTEEELEALTDECTYGNTRTIGSFKILERDDILAIYREACDDISDRTLHR